MPMARITKVSGEANLYHIHVLDPHQGHPDHGLPGEGGVDPGYGVPAPRPRPGHDLPGQGRPGIPDNELPSTPPPTLLPGYTLVMVRGPDGKWKYAAINPGTPPPRPLPEPTPPNRPDNSLPGSPVRPDNSLPGGQPGVDNSLPGSPVAPDNSLPPTAQPKR